MRQLLQHGLNLIIGDTWPKRRRVVYAALIFCACLISAAMGAAVVALDMSAVVSIAGYAFMLGGSVIGSYVFGSVWDDNNKRKHLHLPKPAPTEETAE